MRLDDVGNNAKRRTANAERIPFSPLYVCCAALTSLLNLRAVAGKSGRTRGGKSRTFAVKAGPLDFPAARRSQ
jgi:hypothetical protein